jgi:hypothetical protein
MNALLLPSSLVRSDQTVEREVVAETGADLYPEAESQKIKI